MGVYDQSEGEAWLAMVEFEEARQGLALLEGDQGQEDVAGERQIKRSGGFAMAVPIFLPGTGVAFVVVAVFHRPVPARRLGRTFLFVHSEAADKVAQVAFLPLKRVLFLCPITPDADGRAGSRQTGVNGRDWGDGTTTYIQSPVVAFLAQGKRGVSWRACFAPAKRLEVPSLVPIR